MAESGIALVREGIEIFNRRDVDAFVEMCDPEVEIVPLRAEMEDTRYHGLEGARAFFIESDEIWDKLRIEVEEIREREHGFLLEGRLIVRGKGSGVPVDMPMGILFRFREGKVVLGRFFMNREEARAAAGADVGG